MARNSLLCADVPIRNYSITHSAQLYLPCAVKRDADTIAIPPPWACTAVIGFGSLGAFEN